jgi:hypothetical protein
MPNFLPFQNTKESFGGKKILCKRTRSITFWFKLPQFSVLTAVLTVIFDDIN